MKTTLVALLTVLVPLAGFAEPLLVSPSAEYAPASAVADNIKTECSLPSAQTESVVQQLNAAGMPAQAAGAGAVPAQGRFLKLQIESAVSAGSAFTGHRKQVTTSAELFENGASIAKTTQTRDSMGGVFGGYRSSCSVLHRCTNALGKDIATWLKSQPGQ
ncbi:MAG: hypothetical protein ABFS41_16190 [Myxococcota bacterium]